MNESHILNKKKVEMTDFKDKKVFIAGPMRGYEKYNFPKFDRIETITPPPHV